MPKTRLNVSLDQDLADFAKAFAAENRTSVADMGRARGGARSPGPP